MSNSAFLTEIKSRGFIYQESDAQGMQELMIGGPQTAYVGYDCTADSLHVGSLMSIMLMRRWQQAGNRPIILLGGATTLIGDPSGKDQSRQLLTQEQIQSNKESLREVFTQFLDFDDPITGALMVDNYDWWKDINYLSILRDIGPLMTVNRMLTFDTVQRRLEREQPLTFLEFNYMILQGYDFVHLAKKYQCRFQFGGSDQWGNMISGLELARKMGQPPVFVLTTPLLTTATGAKMGKTEQGAVWLKKERLSDFDYWQFWRNVDDRDVERFLKIFTDLPITTIEEHCQLATQEALNAAKILLANEQTRLCRGHDAQESSYAQALAVFAKGDDFDPSLLPRLELTQENCLLADFLVQEGLASSKSNAKTLIKQGGVKIDHGVVNDEFTQLHRSLLTQGSVLSVGKKRHFMLIAKAP